MEYSQVIRDYFGDDLEAVDAAHQSHKAYLANGGTVSIEDWFYRASTNIDYLTIEGQKICRFKKSINLIVDTLFFTTPDRIIHFNSLQFSDIETQAKIDRSQRTRYFLENNG